MRAEQPEGTGSDETGRARQDALLRQLKGTGDFPAVSRFLTEVLDATRSDIVSTQRLSTLILKDFSLTNAILRLVNSSYYRHAAEQQISTISRAILLLGIDTVTTIAVGLTVFERLAGRSDVKELKGLTVRALLTALYAREIASMVPGLHPEEAFICGMMLDLGRVTVAFNLPEQYRAIQHATTTDDADEEAAARRTLAGLSYRDVGQAMAQAWNLPQKVQDTTGSGDDEHATTTTPLDRLRAAVLCARALSATAATRGEHERHERLAAVVARFGEHLPVTARRLDVLLTDSAERVDSLAQALHIGRRDIEQAAPGLFRRPAAVVEVPDAPPEHGWPGDHGTASPRTSTEQRAELFVTTLGEIGYAIAQDYPLNDIFMMILEGMYRTIGFEHVLLALITPDRTALRGRFGLGDRSQHVVPTFTVPLRGAESTLATVITGPTELLVADTADAQAVAGIPPEFLALLHARTFMMLPLVIRGAAIGAFYVDRLAGQGTISEIDQRDLRVLVNQAVLAVRQTGKA